MKRPSEPATDDEVDALMAKVYESWQRRWCEALACCCMGCVNRSGFNYMGKTITREQWEAWMKRNPSK